MSPWRVRGLGGEEGKDFFIGVFDEYCIRDREEEFCCHERISLVSEMRLVRELDVA